MDKIFEEAERVENLIRATGKTPEKAILKLVEETGELVSALEALSSYKNGNYEHVQEEAVDMLQCAMSVYFLIQNEKPFDGYALMKAKNDKWQNKYLEAAKQAFERDQEISGINDPWRDTPDDQED